MIDLKQNVQYVKGVGPAKVQLLNNLGIYTLADLITFYPREYEDRSKIKSIESVTNGEETTIEARVISEINVNRIRKNMTILKAIVEDNTGRCTITWFNQDYIKKQIKRGETYRFYGKISKQFNQIEMKTPVFDIIGNNKNTGKIMPIYSATYGLTQNAIRQAINNSLEMIENKIEETLPNYLLNEYNLCGLEESLKQIHFPENMDKRLQARKRLVFEELLTLQLALLELKSQSQEQTGITFNKDIKMSEIINSIPFHLTKAQLRVLEEIDRDMESTKAMNRLLQGDVGSRKDCCRNYKCI